MVMIYGPGQAAFYFVIGRFGGGDREGRPGCTEPVGSFASLLFLRRAHGMDGSVGSGQEFSHIMDCMHHRVFGFSRR